MAYLHLQDQNVAAGGLKRVEQAHEVRVLEPLQQVELLGHPVSLHQLLVHVFNGDRTFGAAVIAALDDGETTPEEKKRSDS